MANKYANLIISLAERAGLPANRARELVAASIRESGLNPGARNRSSGAAGLFQLLSSGYVNAANRRGGVYNPRANIQAILPAYINYWRTHPNAAPGEGAATVEASGEPASWYAQPLQHLRSFGNGGGRIRTPFQNETMIPPVEPIAPRNNIFLQSVLNSPTGDLTDAMPAIIAARRAAERSVSPSNGFLSPPPGFTPRIGSQGLTGPLRSFHPAELLHEGIGGPTHSTGPHIHVAYTNPQAILAAIGLARKLGLSVGENPYTGGVAPVHAPHSFHYRTFPGLYHGKHLGEAIDVTGPQMLRFFRLLGGK